MIYNRIGRLIKETSIYTFGNIILRSFSVVTMPIFTRFMSPTQYGILAIVRTVRDLLALVYESGTPASSMRFYYDCSDHGEQKKLFSTLFYFTMFLGVGVSCILLLAGPIIWRLVIQEIPFYPYGPITFWTVLMLTGGILPRTLFRATGQAKRFVTINFLQATAVTGLSVAMVVVYDMGALGPITATFVVSTLLFGVYFYYLKPYLGFTFSWIRLKECLAFGLPETPVRFSNWAMRMANQIILQFYVALSVVALYSVGYAVGSIMFELAMTAVQSAILPFYYQTAKEAPMSEAKQIFAQVATYNFVLVLFLALATITMGDVLLLIFASHRYMDAQPVVVLIAVASLFQFLFYIPGRGLYLENKTIYLIPLLSATVAVNLGLSFILIPRLGIMGAAWSSLAAFFTRAALTLAVSQRVYHVPYPYLRAGKALLAFVLIIVITINLPPMSPALQISVKAFFLMTFPALLLLLGFFKKEEIDRMVWLMSTFITRTFSKVKVDA